MSKEKFIQVNEKGLRIGESHPNAKLSDAEIQELLDDRAAGLSLSMLAQKWGISKSGAKAIVDGTRRGQVGQRMKKAPSNKSTQFRKKVRVNLRISLQARAKLHRLGGGAYLERILMVAQDVHGSKPCSQ